MKEVFKPTTCIILEDHKPTAQFFYNWAELNFKDISIFQFENLSRAQAWLKSNSSLENILALVDLGLPDGSGVEFIRELSIKDASSKSIVITIQNDDESLFTALASGAYGYVLKDEEPKIVERILGRFTLGECPLSPSIAQRVIRHFHQNEKPSTVTLTARETETLKLIGKGLTVQEAASSMNISASTVAGYVKNIYRKLHISSRAEAAHEAIKRGLI